MRILLSAFALAVVGALSILWSYASYNAHDIGSEPSAVKIAHDVGPGPTIAPYSYVYNDGTDLLVLKNNA
jgi:hypothetical protein